MSRHAVTTDIEHPDGILGRPPVCAVPTNEAVQSVELVDVNRTIFYESFAGYVSNGRTIT
jgi:hypothetical protein